MKTVAVNTIVLERIRPRLTAPFLRIMEREAEKSILSRYPAATSFVHHEGVVIAEAPDEDNTLFPAHSLYTTTAEVPA